MITLPNALRAIVGLPPKDPTTKGSSKVGGYSGPAPKPGAPPPVPPKTTGTLRPVGVESDAPRRPVEGEPFHGGEIPSLAGLEPYTDAWRDKLQELLPQGAKVDITVTPRVPVQHIEVECKVAQDPVQPRQALKDFTYGLIALQIAELGTCCRLKVGCVLLTEEGRVAGMGYNGAGPGMPHCDPKTCNVECRCGRTLHAEQNALFSRTATPYTAYTTHEPCLNCTKELILAGVRRVIFLKPYASIAPAEREARQEWLDHYRIIWDHRPTHGVT